MCTATRDLIKCWLVIAVWKARRRWTSDTANWQMEVGSIIHIGTGKYPQLLNKNFVVLRIAPVPYYRGNKIYYKEMKKLLLYNQSITTIMLMWADGRPLSFQQFLRKGGSIPSISINTLTIGVIKLMISPFFLYLIRKSIYINTQT